MDVTVELVEFAVKLPKTEWLQMVSSRFWSTFGYFDDSELAAGVAEIDSAYSADAEGNLNFTEALVLVKGMKPV